jgi:hypothetical protein
LDSAQAVERPLLGERVKTEMSLHVLAYNVKRLIALLGIASMMDAIRACALFLTLKRLLWAITLLALTKKPEKGYGAPQRFSYSEPSPVPYRQLPDSNFAFLHSLGRLRTQLNRFPPGADVWPNEELRNPKLSVIAGVFVNCR